MKPPKTLKTRLYLWLNNMPAPNNFTVTSADGMEMCGWVKISTIDKEIDLSDIDIDINKAKREALETKKREILEKREIELNEVDDHLASLSKSIQ